MTDLVSYAQLPLLHRLTSRPTGCNYCTGGERGGYKLVRDEVREVAQFADAKIVERSGVVLHRGAITISSLTANLVPPTNTPYPVHEILTESSSISCKKNYMLSHVFTTPAFGVRVIV
ncbi:hypothetical protein B296_00044301 [Ensete ventricosum]|uniref:Uncharacterized protein n=1 Tax=Ensete ventricosum TaxID=4639 RepID=A0A426XEQ9_ENSVE|nr:hypothetical protein B296_00044301 [Ensete ventricosum]